MSALDNLISYYNNSENQIFCFIINQIIKDHRLFFDGVIYDVAERCASSTSTVSRLSSKLGFRNYSEFKHSVYQEFKHFNYVNRSISGEAITEQDDIIGKYFEEMAKNAAAISASLNPEMISNIVDLINASSNVFIFTQYINFSERRLQINLMKKSKNSRSAQRLDEQMAIADHVTKDDVVFAIVNETSESMGIMAALLRCKEQGSKTILITNAPASPFKDKVDYFLSFPGGQNGIDEFGLYAIVDVINIYYRKKYVDVDGPRQFNS